MRALVVFESMWGNTEEIARAVARGLGRGRTVEVVDVAGDAPADLGDVDLLVVGGPTHAFSMSRHSTREDAEQRGAPAGHAARGIREWMATLPVSEHVAVATFDTKVEKARKLPGAAKKAAKEVRRHHLGRLVDTESFLVEDVEGPLVGGELDRAEAWGAELGAVAVVR